MSAGVRINAASCKHHVDSVQANAPVVQRDPVSPCESKCFPPEMGNAKGLFGFLGLSKKSGNTSSLFFVWSRVGFSFLFCCRELANMFHGSCTASIPTTLSSRLQYRRRTARCKLIAIYRNLATTSPEHGSSDLSADHRACLMFGSRMLETERASTKHGLAQLLRTEPFADISEIAVGACTQSPSFGSSYFDSRGFLASKPTPQHYNCCGLLVSYLQYAWTRAFCSFGSNPLKRGTVLSKC